MKPLLLAETWMNGPAVQMLLLAFCFNLFFLGLNTLWLYYSRSQKRGFAFSFLTIGSVVFILSYLLGDGQLELGMALGLFAIFGIIRYRTQQIPLREMTHLFTAIGMSVVNALGGKHLSFAEIILANVLITALLVVYEKFQLLKNESERTLIYGQIENLHPRNREQLLQELRSVTGLNITGVTVVKYHLQKNQAVLKIRFLSQEEDDNGLAGVDDDED